jgi:peptide chain release factor 1
MMEQAHIDRVLARLPEIEARLSRPSAAADRAAYRKLVQEHSFLRKLSALSSARAWLLKEAREHEDLIASEPDGELRELARTELENARQRLPAVEQDLMAALLPPAPNDSRNAVVEIRAGTGGEEAALFAADLFRMYNHFIEKLGWKIGIVDFSPSDIGGYKEVVFTVEGEGAYGTMKFESGGHRVQRVPATEAQGRIHTSAATVAVFPEAEADDEIEIKPDEIRVDIFCSSGPGGQSVNTTYSAVRITHLPTGLVAQSQDERSQRRNRDKAIAVLKARLLDARRREEEERLGKTRRSLTGSGDRSERIRTYNFPQNRLTDHRINLTIYSLDRVMEGEIGGVVKALQAHETEMRMKDELGAGAEG